MSRNRRATARADREGAVTADVSHRTDGELPVRTRRALEEVMAVTPDIGRARGADDLALVTSQSGSEFLVDLREGRCECPDDRYRTPEHGCKHVRRARIACGVRPIGVDEIAAVDAQADLGQHASGPVIVAPDGGVVVEPDEDEAVADEPGECVCEELPDGIPCWSCYRDGRAEFDR